MSVKVNPPPQLRIPDKIFNDPELRSYFEQQQKILFQLWNRTGGTDDLISSTVDESSIKRNKVSEISFLSTRLSELENKAGIKNNMSLIESRITELENAQSRRENLSDILSRLEKLETTLGI